MFHRGLAAAAASIGMGECILLKVQWPDGTQEGLTAPCILVVSGCSGGQPEYDIVHLCVKDSERQPGSQDEAGRPG